MRLRRDHGPRAGMVNSVSSSIRQADPLATRPPPSHSLSSPLKRLCTSPSSIYLSPSFYLYLPISFSLSPFISFPCLSLTLCHPPQNCADTGTTKWDAYLFETYADMLVANLLFFPPRYVCMRTCTTIFFRLFTLIKYKIVASRIFFSNGEHKNRIYLLL